MIPVTKSFLPSIEEYMAQVQRAYDNGWLTNRWELVKELEHKLSEYLELKDTQILCMNNGTIPLQVAVKLLGNKGEIITTPFSYVATTSSIVWEGCRPVFVDIHSDYLTIDETKIEEAITDKTTCILATHVYGNPCNIEEIERIAKKYNLKVIYDAAHCFGVTYKGKSIFEYGDVSTCSFHATKIFHTGEGGAVFVKDEALRHKFFYSHTFGHIGAEYYGIGINGKISELSAAMGLAVLPNMDKIIEKRKYVYQYYNRYLSDEVNCSLINIRFLTTWNYSYYPVVFSTDELSDKVEKILNENNIFPRRYFSPSLNTLPFYKGELCPISEDISRRILCLPSYFQIEEKELNTIVYLIKRVLK